MFRCSINNKMMEYLRYSTNKSLENYKKPIYTFFTPEKDNIDNNISLLPFVSIISFLAGYTFHKLTN